MKRLSLALLLVLGFAAGYAGALTPLAGAAKVKSGLSIGQGQAAKASEYLTAPVEEGEIRRVITATGTLNAIVNVEVGSQLSGEVAELFVDFNDQVKKGQPLAQLDQRSFKARVAEAEAAIEVAEVSIRVTRAKIERARIDALDSEAQLAVLKARSDKVRVNLEFAQNELRRKESLRGRQVGSAVELEEAHVKVSSAAAAVREAEAIAAAHQHILEGTKADVRRVQSELEAAIASVPQKQALLQVAQIDLERTIIRSPIDGVVVGRNVNVGQTLATSLEAKTLFIIAGDLHQMQVEAKVDEADIGKIRDGQEAVFAVDAHPGQQFPAPVEQVRKAPQVQQNVVTYTVILSAANRDNLLLPGMTAVVRITVNKTGPVLRVPLAALRFTPKSPQHEPPPQQSEPLRGKPASIWVAGENGEPKSVIVGLGDDDSGHVAILGGSLALGDRVIVGEANAAPRQLFGIRIGL